MSSALISLKNLFLPNPAKPKDDCTYHYHKIELIQPKSLNTSRCITPTLGEQIVGIVGNALILFGALLVLSSIGAFTFQAAGISIFMKLPEFEHLIMPAIAALLTGIHLSKNELKAATQIKLETGIPGLTFSA